MEGLKSRPKYLAEGNWCLVEYGEPVLAAEIDEAKLIKAVSRKMGCAMILVWRYTTGYGLIYAVDFLKKGA
jgi:hypothetical protein